MKKRNCCQWCHNLCTEPDGFDGQTKTLVCSKECMGAEASFQVCFSDKKIGERNLLTFGVDPNKRGKRNDRRLGT